MADKVLYELVVGKAPRMPTGDGDFIDMVEGDTIESSVQLDVMFPQKFVRADRTDQLAGATARRRQRRLLARVKDKPVPLPAHETKLAKQSQPDTDIQGLMGDQDDDAPQAQRGTKSRATKQEGGEDDGEDVTENFDLAGSNDLTVTHSSSGYTIKDGKKTVTESPLRTKVQVEKKLKEYVGEEE